LQAQILGLWPEDHRVAVPQFLRLSARDHSLSNQRISRQEGCSTKHPHPSAPTRDNWGANASQPYLLNTVAPTVAALHLATGILAA
jgi:hypothetical protein